MTLVSKLEFFLARAADRLRKCRMTGTGEEPPPMGAFQAFGINSSSGSSSLWGGCRVFLQSAPLLLVFGKRRKTGRDRTEWGSGTGRGEALLRHDLYEYLGICGFFMS
ncbi:hypothetical protein JDV02_008078 [Purpureocillium takamizusanense]|uniref:Uncharacterized protein n=1 Tax=Purpureocillium takamizusanense TaxID=2060973 RepID=A0A9Q8QJH0_9HYPO|nr:uncharacterized protein JDV02_008078 [Purpureocillium takamizusanense]UNI22164.1 hypothetical protein JDV02_008078 [Purpureocillium takamizusanense]